MARTPLFVDRAEGAYLWDVDGRRYIDYVLGQGANLLGHAHPQIAKAVGRQASLGVAYAAQHRAEAEVAERMIEMIPSAELIRFNSVGSEAVHGALRLARGHTGREKVIKFEGHYHGWLDPVLYSVHPDPELAGPRSRPAAVAGTLGQTPGGDDGLVMLPFNDLQAVAQVLEEHSCQIAAIILEPLMCNSGAIAPVPGYLEGLRELATQHGALLIFDEIITGFRLAPGGAQERYRVTPDLAVFGKAMAGGMQVSALAGHREVMGDIASGKVAHAGTFNSHPVALAAAEVALRLLDEDRDQIYPRLDRHGQRLMAGIRSAAQATGVPVRVEGPGSVFQVYFTDAQQITDYRDYAATDLKTGHRVHELLLQAGINIVPRGLWFMSAEHTEDDIDATIDIVGNVFAQLGR